MALSSYSRVKEYRREKLCSTGTRALQPAHVLYSDRMTDAESLFGLFKGMNHSNIFLLVSV